MTVTQCRGITLKGERCKRMAKNGYCALHAARPSGTLPTKGRFNGDQLPLLSVESPDQFVYAKKKSQSPKRHSFRSPMQHISNFPLAGNAISSSKTNRKKDGYIYVYTYTKFIAPYIGDPVQVNSPYTKKNKNGDKWETYNPKKSDYTLIKVGMTTKSVQARISEWEKQCGISLTSLQPFVDYHNANFVEWFKQKCTLTPNFSTFKDKGFTCSKVAAAEAEIHSILRQKYGHGNLYCPGCRKEDQKLGRHTEWFYVKKKDFPLIFKTIDSVCKRINGGK